MATSFFKEMNKLATQIQKNGGKKKLDNGCEVFKIKRQDAVKKASKQLKGKSKKPSAKQVAAALGGTPSDGFKDHEIAKDFLGLHSKTFAKATILKTVDNLEIAVKGKKGKAMQFVRDGLAKIRRAANKLKAGQRLPINISAANRKMLREASKKQTATAKRKPAKKSQSVSGISL